MPAKKSETDAPPTASGIPVYCSHSRIVPVSELKPHPDNAKKHPKGQIRRLAKIIRGNGWRNPIVVSRQSGYIVKGHGRLESAKYLKVDVPVDDQDYESEQAERADRIADNKIGEYGEWDHEKLSAELEAMRDDLNFDVELSGLNFDEIDKALDAFAEKQDGDKPNTTEILEVAVQCSDEDEQQRVLAKLSEEGYRVRAAKSKLKDK